MRISQSIESVAPAEKLWLFLTEPEKVNEWCFTIRKLRQTGERRGGVGTTFSFEERAGGWPMKLDFIVTEWVINESMAFTMTSGNLVKGYAQRYTIETIPTGIRFTVTEDIKMPWGVFGEFVWFFRKSFSEANLGRMLVKLKTLAEA